VKRPKIVIFSLWRNDVNHGLAGRANHLLSKTYSNLRWSWLVGDCQDDTHNALKLIKESNPNKDIEIIYCDAGVHCANIEDHRKRLSVTFNEGFDCIRDDDDYCIHHESDIISPDDVVERLVASKKCPIAAWPTRETPREIFYDTWAYRRNGVHFDMNPPYHTCYRPDELFEVDSVGSVWMFHAEDIRSGVRCYEEACVELCRKLKEKGRRIWVNPEIKVLQPEKLLWSNKSRK
jgi:hypothetical protein